MSPKFVYSFLGLGSCGCCGSARSFYSSGLPRFLQKLFCAEQVQTALCQLSLSVCQLRLNLSCPKQPGVQSANVKTS